MTVAVHVQAPILRAFYEADTLAVAPKLLGAHLVRESPEGRVSGRIVETEAYIGPQDPASHTWRDRRTARTEVQYGPAGHAYVFRIYGLHDCFCVVTAPLGKPEVVLIRAVEPLEGLDLMASRRSLPAGPGRPDPRLLTLGPARLCQAYGITREDNGCDLCRPGGLHLTPGRPAAPGGTAEGGRGTPGGDGPWLAAGEEVAATPRINIDYAGAAAAWPWRFIIRGNRFVSR